ncbi:MAG: ZIP family metal transporter [Lachnospiraceae bacterium]|nr:ZIP family metal transporter [Lachnospiraceae bacterium]
MTQTIIIGLLIPFAGTVLGSAMVFFMKNEIPEKLQKTLLGFASGVMVAASVWSLLIPSMEMSVSYGKLAFVPAAVGMAVGMGFLLIMDEVIPHLHLNSDVPEGTHGEASRLSRSLMLILAVTLHNLPEGMAVGVVFAGALSGHTEVSLAGAMSLAIGIAIQNFPEGAIISMPLKGTGISRTKAFMYGALSGAVEPVGALLMILLSSMLTPLLPYFLSFAAGAMLYVVIEELIPEASEGIHTNLSTIGFAVGFILMMILDVALG